MSAKPLSTVRVTDYVPLKIRNHRKFRKMLNTWFVSSQAFKPTLRLLKQRGVFLTYQPGRVTAHLKDGKALGVVAFVDGFESTSCLQLLTMLLNIAASADFQEYLPIEFGKDASPHHGELAILENLNTDTWHEVLLPWKRRDIKVVLENKSEFEVRWSNDNRKVLYVSITRAPDWPHKLLEYLRANYKRFQEILE